jgi:hypothetical protein
MQNQFLCGIVHKKRRKSTLYQNPENPRQFCISPLYLFLWNAFLRLFTGEDFGQL